MENCKRTITNTLPPWAFQVKNIYSQNIFIQSTTKTNMKNQHLLDGKVQENYHQHFTSMGFSSERLFPAHPINLSRLSKCFTVLHWFYVQFLFSGEAGSLLKLKMKLMRGKTSALVETLSNMRLV